MAMAPLGLAPGLVLALPQLLLTVGAQPVMVYGQVLHFPIKLLDPLTPESEVAGGPGLPVVGVDGVVLKVAPLAPRAHLTPVAPHAGITAPPFLLPSLHLHFILVHCAGAGSREHHLVGGGCTLTLTGQGDTR